MRAEQAILITRPFGDAAALAQDIQRISPLTPCIIAPAIKIVPLLVDLLQAQPNRSDVDLIILTSRHAVCAAAQLYPDTTCVCVGGATQNAAVTAGLKAISANGTAKDVMACVKNLKAQRCVHLHGEHARGEIVEKLTTAGIHTTSQVVYHQEACDLLPEAKSKINTANSLVVPVYSPRSAQITAKFLSDFNGQITLVAISNDAANAWNGPKPAQIFIANQPNAQAMLDAIVPQVHKTA